MLRARKIVFILLSAFLVCIAAYASAAADRSNDFQLITSVELTKQDGGELPSPIPRGQNFRLLYNVSIPNVLSPELGAGDFYYLNIPPEIPVKEQGKKALKQDEIELAQWEVLKGNIIKVTFSEGISTLSNRIAKFWLDLGFDTSAIGQGGETQLDFDLGLNQNQTITVVFDTPPAKPAVSKTGEYLTQTNEILWKININPGGVKMSQFVIRDIIPDHTAFVDQSIRYDGGVNLPPFVTWTLNGDLLQINIDNEISSSFAISFRTRVLDSAFQGLESGQVTLISNRAIVGHKDGSVHTNEAKVPVSVEYAYKTGKHDNVNKTITWTVGVNPQGYALKNVTVKDTLPAGLSYINGSMNPAPAGGVTVNGQEISMTLGDISEPKKFTYQTRVADELYTGGEHQLTNKLEIGKEGGPPGPTGTGSTVTVSGAGNIKKDGPKYNASTTYPAGYDPATGTITWTITVNESSLTMKDPVISDVLADTTHTLVADSVVVSCLPDGVTANTVYHDNKSFTTSVTGTVTGKFTITLKTRLQDPKYFKNNYTQNNPDKATWPKNTVTLKVGDMVQSASAVAYIRSLVLEKSSGNFNEPEKSVTYTLTVNRNRNTLGNVVVTDKIPRPLLFEEGSLKYHKGAAIPEGTAGSSFPYYTYTATPDDPSSSGTVTIYLGNISTMQTLELTGVINMEDPKAMDLFLKPGNKTLTNRATLKHEELPGGTPEVTAQTTFRTSVVEKTGSSPPNTAFINWKVTINKSGLDMDGFVLTDDLPDGLQLDTTTLVLYKRVVNDTGEVSYSRIDIPQGSITYDQETGLITFTMPSGSTVPDGTYRLDFTTLVVAEVQGNYSNSATLKFSKGVANSNTSTVHTQWQGSGGSAWGEVGVLPLTKTEKGKSSHLLKGAKFTLYDQLGLVVAELETDEQGKAKFERLRFDIPYVLKESQPPAGFVSLMEPEGIEIILPGNDPDKLVEKDLENERQGGYTDITAQKTWFGWPEGTEPPAVYLRLMWQAEGESAEWVPDNMFVAPETAVKQPIRNPVTGAYEATWKDLPVNNLAGKRYVYLAKEVDQRGNEFIPTAEEHFYTKREEGLQVTNSVTPTKVRISKTAVNGTAELPGALLKVLNTANGATVEEWTSTDMAHVIELEPGTYQMIETTAPEGYEIAESITFRVNLDGTVDIQEDGKWLPAENALVRMQDALTPRGVTFSKTAVNGTAELPGVLLKVVNTATGNTVEEWTSTDTAHVIELQPGTYQMIETTAPEGYEIAESITFRVNLDGSVDIQEGNEWVSADKALVHMEDAFTTHGVTFSKTAVNGTAELPGALLKVLNTATDTTVEEWTSTDTAHVIELEPGTYQMIETTAPEGYEIAESITFRVNLNGSVDIQEGNEWVSADKALVHMEDALMPVPEPVPSYDTLRVPLGARKTLRNGSLKAGAFTFVLKDGAGRVIAEASNDQNGLVTFPDRTFSRVVTNYLYTIEEKQGTATDITYDQTIFTVKVTTRAVEGKLVAQVDILRDGVPYAGEIHFMNTRKAPATGDSAMYAILALLFLSGLLLGGGILMRRREETGRQG